MGIARVESCDRWVVGTPMLTYSLHEHGDLGVERVAGVDTRECPERSGDPAPGMLQTKGEGRTMSEPFAAATVEMMRSGIPASGHVLARMVGEFETHLSKLPEIDGASVVVGSTDAPERLMWVACRATPETDLRRALRAVEAVWLTSLRFPHTESHRLRLRSDRAEMHFVSLAAAGRYFVTGIVAISATAA